MSSGAASAWKLVTPTVSKTREPTQAMSTFPAFTSSSVPASYSGSPSAPLLFELDLERPAREPVDLLREAAQLPEAPRRSGSPW